MEDHPQSSSDASSRGRSSAGGPQDAAPSSPKTSAASSERRESEGDEPVDQLSALFREKPLPPEGGEAVPVWLWVTIFGVVLFGTYYMGQYIGDFSPYPWLQQPELTVAEPASAAAAVQVDGAQIYSSRCASCHQANGEGIAGVFPPISGSRWVTGEKARVIRILLHGMKGEVEVKGETYNGNMPAWKQLSDKEIAAVITHERTSWGNDASPISAEEVAAIRAFAEGRTQQWTADELNSAPPLQDVLSSQGQATQQASGAGQAATTSK